IGGGVESMSRVPMGSDNARLDGNNPHLQRRVFQVPQAITADLCATRDSYDREALDRFARASQHRAEHAQREGWFSRSLIPVRDPETGSVLLEQDEYPRHGATLEALAQLKPAFEAMGAAALGPGGKTLDEVALGRYPQVSAIKHVHTAGN